MERNSSNRGSVIPLDRVIWPNVLPTRCKSWHSNTIDCNKLDMTTPRIDENWQSKFLNKGTELGCGDLSIMIGTVSEILDKVKDEAHQAGKKEGIDEAVKIMESMKEDGETPFGHQELHETELAYNQALDDTIKALTDKK